MPDEYYVLIRLPLIVLIIVLFIYKIGCVEVI